MNGYGALYDTPSNRQRARLARALKDFASRVQKSVFETHLPTDLFRKMTVRLTAIVDNDEDSLRIHPMPANSLAQVKVFGKPELTRVEAFLWAGKQPSGGKKTRAARRTPMVHSSACVPSRPIAAPRRRCASWTPCWPRSPPGSRHSSSRPCGSSCCWTAVPTPKPWKPPGPSTPRNPTPPS